MMTSFFWTGVNIIPSLIIFTKLNVVYQIALICCEQQFSTATKKLILCIHKKFVPMAGLLDITIAKT